ncbi:MAG: cytochrome P450 [Novosphingobium sp.]|nr:cytochrome P450 [Novosphingobium sp.]
MSDVLVSDDPLYEALYDVRNEAKSMGNLIEGDPYPAIAALREQGPVHEGGLRERLGLPPHFRHVIAEGRRAYSVLGWEACEAAFRNPACFSSAIVHHPNPGNEKTMGILEMDGAEHRAYRRTLQPIFIRPQAYGWWRQRFIDDILGTLIDRLRGRDRAELNLDLCARLPVHTITRAMGLTGDEALTFRDAFHKSGGLRSIPPEVQREAAETVRRMLNELILNRHADPQDDLITRLITSELRLPDGTVRTLDAAEALHTARLVMIAGGGTTWRQLGIALWALLTHPEALEAVKADRKLLEPAVDEATRWNTTAPLFCRLVTQDTEFYGVRIPEGAVLDISIGSANRDPARWGDPDAFDIFRQPRPHLGFGIGEHRCLGIDVAKSEMVAAMGALLDAFPNLRLDPEAPPPFVTGGLEQRGMSALPVLLQ